MSVVHHYAVLGVVHDGHTISSRLCATCDCLTSTWCLSCSLPMCLGCRGHHPHATLVGSMGDIRAGTAQHTSTRPRWCTPLQLVDISAILLLLAVLVPLTVWNAIQIW